MSTNIVVTGSSGQLGSCLHSIAENYKDLNIEFFNSSELDITSEEQLNNLFANTSIDYVINCAAYTNVEQAEKEPEKAYQVNTEGVRLLAESCKENDAVLVDLDNGNHHIITKYDIISAI